MKIIIAGGRDFTDYELLKTKCDSILKNLSDVEIVCGMAKGADLLGKRYAEEKGFKVKEFPADWSKHGKSAGVIRNEEMKEYSYALIAFWDYKSRGTKNMIEISKKGGLEVRIIRY
jgi:hypothetical protein